MFKFISSLFKKKEKVELEVLDYPNIKEMKTIKDRYHNEQHKKAMQAEITEDLDDELRRKGLL